MAVSSVIKNKKIILAVDDASANLQLINGVLGEEFDLRLAKSGDMALMALERVVPHLILLDIEMPGMSGFDLMQEIRKKPDLESVPVVIITAHGDREFVLEAKKQGARDYIIKPFDVVSLQLKVSKILVEEQ
ncbi:MAG: response regulator [Spirochaetaceae bacterium]|jgi:PleD family two-component response regulator|nr:response regulator [Spirochaetaceae bacterium]